MENPVVMVTGGRLFFVLKDAGHFVKRIELVHRVLGTAWRSRSHIVHGSLHSFSRGFGMIFRLKVWCSIRGMAMSVVTAQKQGNNYMQKLCTKDKFRASESMTV